MNILNKHKLFSLFLLFHFFEISFFGSGRLFEFGPLTLRMYMFIFVLILSPIYLYKLNLNILFCIILYIFSICLSLFIGLIINNDFSIIIEHIKPLLFFLEIIFVYQFVSFNDFFSKNIFIIYKYVGLLLSFSFLILLVLFFFEKINFSYFYDWAFEQNEFVFRPQENGVSSIGFFYKGFIYIGVSIFFFIKEKSKIAKFYLSVLILALILTLTRGLILSFLITFILYLFIENKGKILFYFVIFILLIFFFYTIYLNLIGNKEESNSIRIDDFNYIIKNLNFFTFLFGHGFGSLINSRTNVENSFLDIFFKQGFLGIISYLFLIFRITKLYFKYYISNTFFLPFFYASIFIYLESFTNPFLNNPIGISFIIVAFSIFEKNKTMYKIKKYD